MNARTGKYGMTPLEIRSAIEQAGLNQTSIARVLGIRQSAVSRIIAGTAISRRVHEAIAEAIGVSKEQIWPDRYMVPGNSRGPGRPAKIWDRKAA